MSAPTSRPNGHTGRAMAALAQSLAPSKTAQQRGRGSRTKGQSGEREVAAIIRELTGHDVRRRVRQHQGDSDLEGLPFWCVEVKRHAAVTPFKLWLWWSQAVDQARASQSLPVLFYRGDRAEWRCVWNADLHRRPIPQPLNSAYEATVTGTPETWWALCQHLTNRRP